MGGRGLIDGITGHALEGSAGVGGGSITIDLVDRFVLREVMSQ